MKATETTKLGEFYMDRYPEDDMGIEIYEDLTFEDLFNFLDRERGDIYEFIGAYDSIVRERLFKGLCEVTRYTYNEIYNQWLYGHTTT